MSLFGAWTSRRAASGLTVVDDRLTVRGDLETEGTVRIDGRVEGEAHRLGTLIVGKRGSLVGSVEAEEVVVAGIIEGNVCVTGRIEIESGAAVHGDVRASAMVLRDGGQVHGHVSISGTPSPVATATERRLELAPMPEANRVSA